MYLKYFSRKIFKSIFLWYTKIKISTYEIQIPRSHKNVNSLDTTKYWSIAPNCRYSGLGLITKYVIPCPIVCTNSHKTNPTPCISNQPSTQTSNIATSLKYQQPPEANRSSKYHSHIIISMTHKPRSEKKRSTIKREAPPKQNPTRPTIQWIVRACAGAAPRRTARQLWAARRSSRVKDHRRFDAARPNAMCMQSSTCDGWIEYSNVVQCRRPLTVRKSARYFNLPITDNVIPSHKRRTHILLISFNYCQFNCPLS